MEEQDLLTPQEFAAQVKAKYPQYKDVEDSVLVDKMITKYPQYKDKINFESVEVPEVSKGVNPKEATDSSSALGVKSISSESEKTNKYRLPTEDELIKLHEDSYVEIVDGVKIPKGNVIDLNKARSRSKQTLLDITDDLDSKEELKETSDIANLVGVDIPEDRILGFKNYNEDAGVKGHFNYTEMVKQEIKQKVSDSPTSDEVTSDPYKNYEQYRNTDKTELGVYNIFNTEGGELDGVEDLEGFKEFLISSGSASKYDREIAPHYNTGDYLYSEGDTQVQAYKNKMLTDYFNSRRVEGLRDFQILSARQELKGEDNKERLSKLELRVYNDTKKMLSQVNKFTDLKQRFQSNIKKEKDWEEYLRGGEVNVGKELSHYGSTAWNSVTKILLGTVGSALDMVGDIAENPLGKPSSSVDSDFNIFHSSAKATDDIFDMVSVDMPNLQKSYLSYKEVEHGNVSYQVDSDSDTIYKDGVRVTDLDYNTSKQIITKSLGVKDTDFNISGRATTSGTMNMITQLYMMVKTAKALPIKNYSAAAGFSGVLQTHHDTYSQTKQQLEEAIVNGKLDAPIEDVEGLAKMNAYLNDVVVFSAGMLSPNKPLAGSNPIDLAKELYKKDLNKTLSKRISDYAGTIFKESFKELGQEESELIASKNINALTNIIAGETLLDTEIRKSEVAETALITLLGTGIATGTAQRGKLTNGDSSFELYKNAVKLSNIDTPSLQKAMQRSLENGDLTQEQVKALNETLLNIGKHDGKIPKNISSTKIRQDILPLLEQREKLELEEKMSDPAFRDDYKIKQEELSNTINKIVRVGKLEGDFIIKDELGALKEELSEAKDELEKEDIQEDIDKLMSNPIKYFTDSAKQTSNDIELSNTYLDRAEKLNNIKNEEASTPDRTGQAKDENKEGAENAKSETVQAESQKEVEATSAKNAPVQEREIFKKGADAFRSAKFYKTPSDAYSKLQSDPTGLLKFAWDGAMETMATTIETTGKIDTAVRKGVAQLKQSEWYQNLSADGKKQAVTMFEKDSRDALQPMADSFVKVKKTPVKTQVRKFTGQTDTSKKITMTEKSLFKKQMKDLQRGSKLGAKGMMDSKKQAIKAINESVKPLVKKYKDNTLYAKAYNKAMSAVNQYNGNNFDKVEKAIADIEVLIQKEALNKSIKKNRKNAKTKVKTTYGKTGDPIRRILRYKPEWLGQNELAELDEVLSMFSKSAPQDFDMSKVTALEEKLKESYLDQIGERIERKKDDSDSFQEKDELAGLMRKLKPAANRSDLSEQEREVVRDFNRIEPEYFDGLSKAELREINKHLTALVEDGMMLNQVMFDHVRDFDAQVTANELSGKLGDNLLQTNKSFLETIKSTFSNKKQGENPNDIFNKVQKRMLQHIDGVVKNFKNNGLYKTIIHPLTSKMEKANNFSGKISRELTVRLERAKTSREGSRTKRLGKEVKASAKISDQMSKNYEYRLQVLMQLYFRQKEYQNNPEFKNNKVFAISEHIEAMNSNPKSTTLVDPDADIKVINEIYEKFKSEDGNIDIDKVDNYFTKEEKALVDFVEKTILDLESKNRFINDHIRGESLTYMNSYFPRKSGKAVSQDSSADVVAMSRMLGALGIKSDQANERVLTKAEPLDFDTLGTFMNYVNSSALEYEISPQLKKMRKVAALLAKEGGEKASLGQILVKAVEATVRAKVNNVNDPINSRKEKFFNILKRKTFNKILIDPIKMIGWDIPSSWGVIGLANMYRAGRIKTATKNIDRGLMKTIMEDLGSVHVERIGSRSVDIKETSSSTISKSKYKQSNPKRRDNAMDLVNKNLISDTADKISDIYYKIVDLPMGMLWSTEMYEEFKKLTGKELNSSTYDAAKNDNPKELARAIAKADKEISNVFNTASVSEQKLSVQAASSTSVKKFIDSFMKSFAFNEHSVMWDALRSFAGKGNMTMEEAIRNFSIVNARGILYAYASQMVMGAILPMMMGTEMEDEEIDNLNEKAMNRAFAQHGMLFMMGNYGNVANMFGAILIEQARKVYFTSQGEKYNPYEDSVLFALPERGKASNYVGALGAEGEVLKVAFDGVALAGKIAEKLAKGEDVTEKDLIDWKTAGYSLSLLSQLTGISTYRIGKLIDKQLKEESK